MAISKQQKLNDLKARIETSGVTPELAAQATQLVFGVGSVDAEVLFIGEAPGKNEDLQGEPFVGAAGKFLNEMLAGIGLGRSDIYITNIVKYRPPGNRDPLPDEKKAFLPYLQEQIEIIQPKIIVTLGRHSGGCFLPDLHISADHGKPKRLKLAFRSSDEQPEEGSDAELELRGNHPNGFPVVILPLYHPAAALYNGAMRETLIEDFSLIPIILEKIKQS